MYTRFLTAVVGDCSEIFIYSNKHMVDYNYDRITMQRAANPCCNACGELQRGTKLFDKDLHTPVDD